MRNIIYHTLGIVVNKGDKYNKLYMNDRETTLYNVISDMIEESRNEKAEVFTAFCGLKYQALSIVNYLYKTGYVLMEDVNKKDLRVNTYRLRYTGKSCYYIQIKTGYKSYVTLQNIEDVIGLKTMPKDLAELKTATALYNYTRDEFLGGCQNAETRLLYGSASISRTMFNRCNNNYCKNSNGLRKLKMYGTPANQYIEQYTRPAIHGGYNYLSEKGMNYRGAGIVLDVNSLYDYVASTARLPYPYIVAYGEGVPNRKFIRHKYLYYTITKVTVSATLKENGIPCILADGAFSGAEYLTKMEKRPLTLTEADRKMLYDNYDISYYRIDSYIVFKASRTTFKDYIAPLYEQKRTLPKGIKRDFVKSMLVGFIGTFARKAYTDKYIFAEKDGYMIAQKTLKDGEELKKAYKRLDGLCFVNAAIVSASRAYIVSYIKKHMDRFLYTDTDSIHLSGTAIPDDIPISDKMGDFKIEHIFTKCEYCGIKKYMIVESGQIIPTIAGVPKDSFDTIGRAEGVNPRKIKKYISKQNLYKLFDSSIAVAQLTEDIETGTCAYEYHGVRLADNDKVKTKVARKMEAYRKRREGYDYYTGKEISKSLYDQYGRDKENDHIIDKWNDNVESGNVVPSFDLAVAYLSREIHIKRGEIWCNSPYDDVKGWWTIDEN